MFPLQPHKFTAWLKNIGVPILFGLLVFMFVSSQVLTTTATAETGRKSSLEPAAITIAQVEDKASSLLALGARSDAVKALKTSLIEAGYNASSRPPSRQFDKATELAVRQFQADHGLIVDGIAGPHTQQKLAEIADAERSSTATVAATSPANRAATPATSPANIGAANDGTMPPDILRIINRGKLIVSVLDRDNPPFFMTNKSDQLYGSDIQVAKEIAEALGVDVEFRRSAATFNEVVDDVYQHNADIAVSKISRTLNRAKRNRFSTPYLNLRQGLLLNRLSLAQASQGKDMTAMVRSLTGKIGVIKDSSYARFAPQNFPNATVVSYPDWASVIQAVTSREILGAYRDELEVKKVVLTNPNAALQLQTVSLTDTKDSLSVVLPWDSEHLLAFVNQYLETANLIDTTDGLLEEYGDYFSSN